MTSVLPPPRDLPPYRHAQLRAELQRETAGPPSRARSRLVPMVAVAGLTVLALVALGIWLMPGRAGDAGPAVAPRPTTPPQTKDVAQPPNLAIPGLSDADRQAIEHGCGQSGVGNGSAPPTPGMVDTADTFRLYNVLDDPAGRLTLLYGKRAALACEIGGPVMPYNPALAGVGDLGQSPIMVDLNGASAGGDAPGGKSEYRGQHGNEYVGGRISAHVAKVTMTSGKVTVTAVLANGTYLARIVHPTTWRIPDHLPPAVVRAYDATGNVLATVGE